MAKIIDLDDVDKTPHSSPVRDLILLMNVMEMIKEKDKKEEEEKKKKDGDKKKSGGGSSSDFIGNAIILTIIQMTMIPGAFYLWSMAISSIKTSLAVTP